MCFHVLPDYKNQRDIFENIQSIHYVDDRVQVYFFNPSLDKIDQQSEPKNH